MTKQSRYKRNRAPRDRHVAALLAMTVILFTSPHLACAQQPAYPAKPIRLIASQAPGGGIDAVSRIVAPKLAGALFRSMTKIELLHVPYKGGGPAMVDLVAGQTQLGFASTPSTLPFISSGKLRALAVSTARRSKILPQLPTIAEAGVPGYESHSWYGFVVPAKTPQVVIARLNKELVQILNLPDTGEALIRQGLDVWTTTPEAFGAYIKSEYDKWGRVIRAADITEN